MSTLEHKHTRDMNEIEHKFTRKMEHASFIALLLLITFQFFVLGMIVSKHHAEVLEVLSANP